MDPYPCWATVAVAAVASCYLSLILGALRSYSLARFEERLGSKSRALERLLELLDHSEEIVIQAMALRGVVVTAGMVALTGAFVLEAAGDAVSAGQVERTWGWWGVGVEATLVGTLLFVALGYTVPHAIGERRAEAVLTALLPSLRAFRRLAAPVGWLFGGLATVTLRVANLPEVDEAEEVRDELLSAALAGESEGVIDEAMKEVIENLIEFRDVDVTEVMTPRIDIVSVPLDATLEQMARTALEHGLSRLPVTEGSIDKIVGVILAKDLLRAVTEPSTTPTALIRKAFFVPETKKVADLLKELRANKVHMAVVADEYGGTAGLVTMEDLIEEIIGDISDEADKPDVPVRRLSESEVDVDAKLHIDELNEEFDTELPEDQDVETLGGFIALQLGRIPAKGDRVEINGHSFTVTEADERRATRVLIKLK